MTEECLWGNLGWGDKTTAHAALYKEEQRCQLPSLKGTRSTCPAASPTRTPVSRALQRLHVTRGGKRRTNPRDILLPEGYVAEVVATGFTAPVHCTFDDQSTCYICEAGHKTDTAPRIVKVDTDSGACEPVIELPADRWHTVGALTGACSHDSALYFANTDTLSRITSDGRVEDLVVGLPGLGDHQTNYPIVGPDGKVYIGVGSATNTGVVGADNFTYEWLPQYPRFHDVPARDVTLAGCTYAFQNVLGDITETVQTGAYVYAELNVLTALWRRAIFVPGIFATSDLSIHIAQRYGMPKQPIAMRFEVSSSGDVIADAMHGSRASIARSRPLGLERLLTGAAVYSLPRWSWPVRFPSGSAVRALLLGVSAMRLMGIGAGRLALSADWLPRPVRLLPCGLFLSGLRMRLPPDRIPMFASGDARNNAHGHQRWKARRRAP